MSPKPLSFKLSHGYASYAYEVRDFSSQTQARILFNCRTHVACTIRRHIMFDKDRSFLNGRCYIIIRTSQWDVYGFRRAGVPKHQHDDRVHWSAISGCAGSNLAVEPVKPFEWTHGWPGNADSQ